MPDALGTSCALCNRGGALLDCREALTFMRVGWLAFSAGGVALCGTLQDSLAWCCLGSIRHFQPSQLPPLTLHSRYQPHHIESDSSPFPPSLPFPSRRPAATPSTWPA